MASWATSNRASRLPADWANRRRAVKARANGQCQAQTHQPECNGTGSECDHIINNDNHALSNLQWLSGPCHLAKTLAEAQRSRGIGPTKRRPPPKNPGLK